jgi:hypothetical protein
MIIVVVVVVILLLLLLLSIADGYSVEIGSHELYHERGVVLITGQVFVIIIIVIIIIIIIIINHRL